MVKRIPWCAKGKVLVAQSCLTLCDTMDCNPPGFSVHGILQARMLESVAVPFSRGSPRPRDQTQVSYIAGRFFSISAPREPHSKACKFLPPANIQPTITYHHIVSISFSSLTLESCYSEYGPQAVPGQKLSPPNSEVCTEKESTC